MHGAEDQSAWVRETFSRIQASVFFGLNDAHFQMSLARSEASFRPLKQKGFLSGQGREVSIGQGAPPCPSVELRDSVVKAVDELYIRQR